MNPFAWVEAMNPPTWIFGAVLVAWVTVKVVEWKERRRAATDGNSDRLTKFEERLKAVERTTAAVDSHERRLNHASRKSSELAGVVQRLIWRVVRVETILKIRDEEGSS